MEQVRRCLGEQATSRGSHKAAWVLARVRQRSRRGRAHLTVFTPEENPVPPPSASPATYPDVTKVLQNHPRPIPLKIQTQETPFSSRIGRKDVGDLKADGTKWQPQEVGSGSHFHSSPRMARRRPTLEGLGSVSPKPDIVSLWG